MSSSRAATSNAIRVLVADSNRMQSQLLTSALRRRPEFCITTCPMDPFSILQAIAVTPPHVALLSLNSPANVVESVMLVRQLHLSHPEIPKVLLVDSCGRELVVGAFRSGARGIFSISEADLRQLCNCV